MKWRDRFRQCVPHRPRSQGPPSTLQELSRDLFDLSGEFLGCPVDGDATDGNGARTAGSGATLDTIGVALNNAHALGRKSRRSAISCEYDVACPWPVDCEPISNVTPPSRSSVRFAVSGPLLPQASTYVAMPMPRNLPGAFRLRGALLNPSHSMSSCARARWRQNRRSRRPSCRSFVQEAPSA